MAEFVCKRCGGSLNIKEGVNVVVCDYCQNVITLSKFLNDDEIKTLYKLANDYLRNGDYDDARDQFKEILRKNETDSEAYWSLVLCKYKIKYVEKTLTINNNLGLSVFDDANFKNAIKYASAGQKLKYEKDAKEIDRIQSLIGKISRTEKPFDIFISYKDKDKFQVKTEDSILANELYESLVNKGYNVFFSAKTLASRIGAEWGPFINFALDSSKIMIVLGTREEYYNYGWVKNEWRSFYEKIKSGDNEKIIIPVYKYLSPSVDLPIELRVYQGVEILNDSKWVENIVNRINFIFKRVDNSNEKNKEELKEIERIKICLENADWDGAKRLCDGLLIKNKTNADLYILKLLAQLHLRNEGQLGGCEVDLNDYPAFNDAINYADEKTKKRLMEYDEQAEKRLKRKEERIVFDRQEQERWRLEQEKIYVERERLRLQEQERLRIERERIRIYEEQKQREEQRKREEQKKIDLERQKLRLQEEERLRAEREKKRLYEERKKKEEQERIRLEQEERLKAERAKKQAYLQKQETILQKQTCPNCHAKLYQQIGFSSSFDKYVCKGCGKTVYKDEETGNYVFKRSGFKWPFW